MLDAGCWIAQSFGHTTHSLCSVSRRFDLPPSPGKSKDKIAMCPQSLKLGPAAAGQAGGGLYRQNLRVAFSLFLDFGHGKIHNFQCMADILLRVIEVGQILGGEKGTDLGIRCQSLLQ